MSAGSDRLGDFQRLMQQLLEGGLTSDERRELCALMGADPALRLRYLELCQMHAMLQTERGLLAALQPDGPALEPFPMGEIASCEGAPAAAETPDGSASRWWTLAGGLITLGLAVVIGWGFRTRHSRRPAPPVPPAEVVATLTRAVGARFVSSPGAIASPPIGAGLRRGSYDLTAGLVQLDFAGRAQVLVEAPARFSLVNPRTVALLDGRLTAHVPEAAVGFTVKTPSADVVDYGTDFGVDVRAGQNAEVHVFQGEVRVQPNASRGIASQPLQLRTGEASRVDQTTGVPAGINLAEPRFLRAIDAPPSAYRRRVLELGPAVYYPMEPTTDGLTLSDASGHNADGRIELGTSAAGVWAAGRIGAALRLGGPAQQRYGVVPVYPQADGDAISVVAWVNAASRPRWASIAKNWAGTERGQFHFGLRADEGTLECHMNDDKDEQIFVEEDVPLPLNRWHHVAFVADGRQIRLYRAGREVASTPYHGLRRNPRLPALGIGTKVNESGDRPVKTEMSFWDGLLDEVAVFNHALTADQIRELHDLADTP